MLQTVIPHTADVYGRALVMPNTDPPIRTAGDVKVYREEITNALLRYGTAYADSFKPLMTIMLTPETTSQMITEAHAIGVVAAKLYPKGTTTGSSHGISNWTWGEVVNVLDIMADCGMVLCVHAELPDAELLVAENWFIPEIRHFAAAHKNLKIVVEHVSCEAMAKAVLDLPDNVAATITPMHLTMTHSEVLGHVQGNRRGLNPHNFCYPIPKMRSDREFLRSVAVSGNPKFFAGDDSAPHLFGDKECGCGCAGAFSAPASLPTYVEVFEAMGQLDRLEDFVSRFGAEFYGLPLNKGTVRLTETGVQAIPVYVDADWHYKTPPHGKPKAGVRSWRGGEVLRWEVVF